MGHLIVGLGKKKLLQIKSHSQLFLNGETEN